MLEVGIQAIISRDATALSDHPSSFTTPEGECCKYSSGYERISVFRGEWTHEKVISVRI